MWRDGNTCKLLIEVKTGIAVLGEKFQQYWMEHIWNQVCSILIPSQLHLLNNLELRFACPILILFKVWCWIQWCGENPSLPFCPQFHHVYVPVDPQPAGKKFQSFFPWIKTATPWPSPGRRCFTVALQLQATVNLGKETCRPWQGTCCLVRK